MGENSLALQLYKMLKVSYPWALTPPRSWTRSRLRGHDVLPGFHRNQSTSQALLAFVLGRAEEPLSKNAMVSWYARSGLPLLLPPLPALDTRSYMRHMYQLYEATVDRITFRLAQQLKAQ